MMRLPPSSSLRPVLLRADGLRRGALLAGVALFLALGAWPTLSAASSRAGRDGPGVSPDYANILEDRLQSLEAQVQRLTNQAEQAGFQAQQAQTRLQKLEEDLNTRFRMLEERQAEAAATTSPAAPPTPPVPPAATSPSGSGEKTLGQLTSSGDGEDSPSADTPNAAYDKAFAKIRDGDYEAAESGMRAFVRKWPRHELASNASYWLAETFYARGQYEGAAKAFAESYSAYPKGAKAEDTLVKLGLTLSALNRTNDACVTFDQAVKEFPQMSLANHRRIDQERKQMDCPTPPALGGRSR